MLRFRLVEPFGPAVPVQLHISLHRDHRHAKRLHDLFGFYRATHDHLAGEHTEASHVLLFVLEHWHVAVDITHPARLFLYCDLSVDLRHPGRKNRQLKLRHAPLIPQRSLFCKCLPRIISFSPTGQNLRGEIRRSEHPKSDIQPAERLDFVYSAAPLAEVSQPTALPSLEPNSRQAP